VASNVDRLCAIFQALKPSLWFTQSEQQAIIAKSSGLSELFKEDSTWSLALGEPADPTTPLAPFHKQKITLTGDPQQELDKTTFNSDEVRYCFSLGYTYPELQPWDATNKTGGNFDQVKYQSNIQTKITDKYDTHTTKRLEKAPRAELAALTPAPEARLHVPPAQVPQIAPPHQQVTHDDFLVNVVYDR
jgi:tyrosinase